MAVAENPARRSVFLWGLVARKECWILTWKAKLLALLVFAISAIVGAWGLYPFLAVNQPLPSEVLVVEGWVRTDALDGIVKEFNAGGHSILAIVKDVRMGGNYWGSGRYKSDYLSTDLSKLGIPTNKIQLIYCDLVMKDRTYHSAKAVKAWMQDQKMALKSVTVATQGSHARRSRRLYQKAFGPDVNIGVLALPDSSYDPRGWWRSSEGMREVLFEGVAWLYIRFWFSP
jgi:hypothetical protein